MKESRSTDSQILAILKQTDSGVRVPDLFRSTELVAPVSTKGEQVRRDGRFDDVPTKGTGGLEPTLEEDVC